jgi:site-specific recombinase XerD
MKAPQKEAFRSILAGGVSRFLDHKRAVGRRFDVEEKTLRLLDAFLIERDICSLDAVSSDVIDEFLTTRPRSTPRSYNHLLGTVRRLFNWLVEQQVLTISPVQAKVRRETTRRIPFLFDQKTATRLLDLAARLEDNPRAPMRATTYRTIFAILYGLGLRVGEVTRLCDQDLDFDRRLLIIRETKFYKTRLVPFGPRMSALLVTYMKARHPNRSFPTNDSPLFSFVRNRPVNPCTISQTFHALVPQLNLTVPDGVSPPRLHDLRHSFAVGTLLRWYRSGIDPGSRLLQLSTFLGHVSPVSTAEYLTITSDLLREAGERFERFAAPLVREGQR